MRDQVLRIARLADRQPRGCAVCRDWSTIVLVDDDGAISRPDACPACGRVVPFAERVWIVGVLLVGI
jgi:hypothetical protein